MQILILIQKILSKKIKCSCNYLRNKIHAKILKLVSLNIVNNFKQCRMKEKKSWNLVN